MEEDIQAEQEAKGQDLLKSLYQRLRWDISRVSKKLGREIKDVKGLRYRYTAIDTLQRVHLYQIGHHADDLNVSNHS